MLRKKQNKHTKQNKGLGESKPFTQTFQQTVETEKYIQLHK